jgi:hypothetical protein
MARHDDNVVTEATTPGSARGALAMPMVSVSKGNPGGVGLQTPAEVSSTRWDRDIELHVDGRSSPYFGADETYRVGAPGWIFEGRPIPIVHEHAEIRRARLDGPILPRDGKLVYPLLLEFGLEQYVRGLLVQPVESNFDAGEAVDETLLQDMNPTPGQCKDAVLSVELLSSDRRKIKQVDRTRLGVVL